MKPRVFVTIAVVFALVFAALAAPMSAQALILGFYGSGGRGTADWDNSGRNDNSNYDFNGNNMDARHGGGGIVLGTSAPAGPLDYRISIGYEEITFQGNSQNPDFRLHGVVIDQDLLFGMIGRRGPVRLWFGPELRLGFLNGSFDGGISGDQDYFTIGLGPIMGVDIMVSPAMGFSWKLGYLLSEYIQDNNNSGNDGNGDRSVLEGHAFASLSILFSTWGGYQEQPVPPPQYSPRPQYSPPPPNFPPPQYYPGR